MENIRPNAIDPAKLNAFLARAVGDLSAGYGGVMVSLSCVNPDLAAQLTTTGTRPR
jgi:hypothetical protein